jgi:hypothetical protein
MGEVRRSEGVGSIRFRIRHPDHRRKACHFRRRMYSFLGQRIYLSSGTYPLPSTSLKILGGLGRCLRCLGRVRLWFCWSKEGADLISDDFLHRTDHLPTILGAIASQVPFLLADIALPRVPSTGSIYIHRTPRWDRYRRRSGGERRGSGRGLARQREPGSCWCGARGRGDSPSRGGWGSLLESPVQIVQFLGLFLPCR